MKRALASLFAALVTACYGEDAHAFEKGTHRSLTGSAAAYSNLANTEKLKFIGLDKPYSDPSQVFPNSNGTPGSILDLVRDGAEFEDGFDCLDDRPRNHFYNPLTGQGLSGTALGFSITGQASPSWAVEENSPTIPGSRGYAFRDARSHFYKAMTRSAPADRNISLGLMFQTIGHVVHHLQDMAQPQHVRNDMHLAVDSSCFGQPLSAIFNKLVGNPSAFESWTNTESILNGPVASYSDPSAAGYSIDSPGFRSTFKSVKSFWSTRSTDLSDGKGIADFTNRSFVSAGTNFTSLSHGNTAPGFAQPTLDATQYENVDIGELCANAFPPCPRGLQGRMSFVGASVDDRFLGSTQSNRRASSYSFFTQDLKNRGAPNLFALNRFNFDEAYKHLIPRAVAFSAGMINYFFRGDIDLVYDEKAQKYYIANNSDEDMRGAFELYYDGADGTRYSIAQQDWNALAVGRNSRVEVAATFPNWATAQAPKDPDRYILVFHGDMGEEKASGGWEAVAARVVDLSPFVVFLADMGTSIRNVGGADFSMIVPERYETRLREAARSRLGDIVLTIGTREYPAQGVSPPGANGCWRWAECDRITGTIGPDAGWVFYLYRSNQVTSERAGLTNPFIATGDFRNLYARPGATFAWICAFMLEVEASGLSITGWSQANSGEPIGLSLRDPADGSLQRLFEFKARQTKEPATYFDPYVALSSMKNIRVNTAAKPQTDDAWPPPTLTCQVMSE